MRSDVFDGRSAHQNSKKMKIGIIDADLLDNGTRHPNLALMKIAGYLRETGHDYKLLFADYLLSEIYDYDLIIVSKVFSFSKVPPQILMHIGGKAEWKKHNLSIIDQISTYSSTNGNKNFSVVIGGTGFFPDGGLCLDPEIEHHMPDYELYREYVDTKISEGRSRTYYSDYLDYSIGFTTRGCFRKCDFCVNKKYDRAQKHSPIVEFLDDTRPMIYLWDDNFFALFDDWEEILDEIEATGKPFQFRQGLDIRLMSPRHAERLSNSKYHGDFIFAFDHIEDKKIIQQKLKLWRKYTRKTTKLYILCAFDSWSKWDGKSDITPLEQKDIEDTFERIKILMEYGCLPYIMRYETYKKSKYQGLYTQLARWCNQPQFFKKKSFRQFCEANQEYSKNKDVMCSAYQAMLDFEKDRPDIAEKYFDLRFDELNKYKSKSIYAHGDSYPCVLCKDDMRITWDRVHTKMVSSIDVIKAYLLGDLDFNCMDEELKPDCSATTSDLAMDLIDALKEVKMRDILSIIDHAEKLKKLEMSMIPQISDLEDATNNILSVLVDNTEMSFREIGAVLDNGMAKGEVAQRKYGENHSKLAAMLDLVWINDSSNGKVVSLTPIGKHLSVLSRDERRTIIQKLYFRIPVIQHLFKESFKNEVFIKKILEAVMMRDSTIERRRSSILKIIQEIGASTDEGVYARVSLIN
jgi:hypothetical protein